MARLNIEDCWWTDPRRSALIRLVGGDEEIADGSVTKAWRVAQEFWKHGRKLVPKPLFQTLRFAGHLLGAGLAEEREDGIYVRGSSAYLEWIAEQKEAAKENGQKGGKVSAQRPRDEKGRLLPKNSKRDPSEVQANPSQPKLSASASSSLSVSNTQNEESIGAAVAVATPTIAPKDLIKFQQAKDANHFVAAYVTAYQTRFPASRPEDLNDGKVRGQILNWIKGYPLERACELIQVYFQMDTKWFGTKGYDFITFRNNLNKIGQALDSGVDPDGNSIDWSKVDLS